MHQDRLWRLKDVVQLRNANLVAPKLIFVDRGHNRGDVRGFPREVASGAICIGSMSIQVG